MARKIEKEAVFSISNYLEILKSGIAGKCTDHSLTARNKWCPITQELRCVIDILLHGFEIYSFRHGTV